MVRCAALLLLLLQVMVGGLVRAEAPKLEEEARVVEVIDGDTLVLSNGYEVRLIGTQAPKIALGRDGFRDWPLGHEAKALLEELALRQSVGLAYGGRRIDRHGRTLAHLYRADGLWLQGEMVGRGFARVYGFHDNRALLGELLARERAARSAGLGIWADPFYAIRSPAELERDLPELLDSFQLVEGRVRAAKIVGGRAFLNFGGDRHSDFTAVLQPEAVDLFQAEGLDPEGYAGRLVRIRGWVERHDGPMIEVTHPEQIEVLE